MQLSVTWRVLQVIKCLDLLLNLSEHLKDCDHDLMWDGLTKRKCWSLVKSWSHFLKMFPKAAVKPVRIAKPQGCLEQC